MKGAKKGIDTIVELGKTPVIGWQRTITYDKGRKNVKHVVEHSAFELRAWEIGAGVVGGLIVLGFMDFQRQAAQIPQDFLKAVGDWFGATFLGQHPTAK